MNIQEYIAGGMVESYVLGLASAEERAEFEALCKSYPELVTARSDFEIALEKMAFDGQVTAPASAKEKILAAIREDHARGETPVLPIHGRVASNRWPMFVAAAAVLLLLVSAYLAFDFYSKNVELKRSYSRLQAEADSVNNILALQKKNMMDPEAAVRVVMTGTDRSSSVANVYWDTASANVFLVVKNLPKLPSDKQFQLWAFIGGKPIDLGLFDVDEDKVILQMKNTRRAEAFAITIEDRGNGPIPQGPMETYGKAAL